MACMTVASPTRHYLTKTLFQRALQCPRKLRYALAANNQPPQRPPTNFERHLAHEGHIISQYSKRVWYPDGIEIMESDNLRALEQTQGFLQGNDEVTLFEAAFGYGNCLMRADILRKHKDGSIELLEVKAKSYDSKRGEEQMWSKNKIKAEYLPYLRDVAFQTYVMQQQTYVMQQCCPGDIVVTPYLVLPDKSKRNQIHNLYNLVDDGSDANGDDDRRQSLWMSAEQHEPLLAKVNVQPMVKAILDDKIAIPGAEFARFEDCIHYLSDMVERQSDWRHVDGEETAPISVACRDCEFRVVDEPTTDLGEGSGFEQCWSEHGVENANESDLVIDIYYGGRTTTKLLQQQLYTFQDIKPAHIGLHDDATGQDTKPKKKPGMSRRERQWLQISKARPIVFDAELFVSLLKSDWQYPFHFIDFETIAPCLPYTIGKRPYEALAFQFSHHVLQRDGTLQHANEFLSIQPGECPNVHFLDALAETLQGSSGTIFRWGAHENTILKSLLASQDEATSYPNASFVESLLVGGHREMVDLMSVVNRTYYVDGSGGSSSLKSLLLPTMRESKDLRELYSQPTYNGKNFTDMQWWREEVTGGGPVDPYKLLSNERVTHGGDAIVAYQTLQKNNVDAEQRTAIESSLLKYCELDTLAMVMVMEALLGMVKDGVPTLSDAS